MGSQFNEYPDAPLSGWQHYGIMKTVEHKIHDWLKKINYEGYLLGLHIGYIVYEGDETREYSMSFGYVVDNLEYERDREADKQNAVHPLGPEVFDSLYSETRELIAETITSDIEFSVNLQITVSGSVIYGGLVCRPIVEGECKREENKCPAGSRRWLRQNPWGGWDCTHQAC